jgi:hypothetical protein
MKVDGVDDAQQEFATIPGRVTRFIFIIANDFRSNRKKSVMMVTVTLTARIKTSPAP